MPSVQYMNQSAPFWDFISSLEQQGQNHPFFAQFTQNANGNNEHGGYRNTENAEHPPPFGPWAWGGWGGAFPHRGPPQNEEASDEKDVDMDGEKAADGAKDAEKEKDGGEGPSGTDHEGWGGHRRRGSRGRHHGEKGEPSGSDTEGWGGHRRCGGGRRGRHHGPGPHGFGPHGPHGPWGHGHGHHSRGGFGGRGRGWGGPWSGSWGWGRGGPPFNPMDFAANLFNPDSTSKNEPGDFTPDADIFDTPSAYVIHVSLPGAKKEDVGVNWDADKSELSIAGVIYRPGDEEFLKTLAVDERKVGPFERKVRLGTRASPANIDAEGISAKLEDGVLRVEVPKLEREGFVEVRKVDIE